MFETDLVTIPGHDKRQNEVQKKAIQRNPTLIHAEFNVAAATRGLSNVERNNQQLLELSKQGE